MTITDLTSIWDECSTAVSDEPVNQKLHALEVMRSRLSKYVLPDDDLDAIMTRTKEWLANLDQWPLAISRGLATETPSTPKTLRDAVSATADWVWQLITVKAAECDFCGGVDMVYVWSNQAQQVIICCDQCPGTYDLNGQEIDHDGIILPATIAQLQLIGLC